MKRYKIGILINQLEGMYQAPLWKSIFLKAKKLGVDVIFFVGKSPNSPVFYEVNENIIYELVYYKDIDGLIFVSGALVNDIGYEEYVKFFSSYNNVKKVSISLNIPGSPSIIVDNKKAMKEMVIHLIEEHNCKNIAFICGPELHPEAIDRFTGYKDALNEKGITFNPELVFPGDFRIESGREAVRIMLYERKIFPDAIVAANDNMAYSAFQELKRLGYNIPDDIILTGFDDQEDIRYINPPLTTIRQPIEKQGELALEILIDLLEGKNVPELIKLDCELIIRQSCGCIPVAKLTINDDIDIKDIFIKSGVEKFNLEEREKIEKLILSFINGNLSGEKFLKEINKILIFYSVDESYINTFYNIFELLVHKFLGKNSEIVLVFQKVLYLTAEVLKRIEGIKRIKIEWIMQRFRSLTQNIYSITTIKELKEVLYEQFPLFGIKFFALVLFKNEPKRINHIKWKLPEKSDIIFYYNLFKNDYKEDILIETRDILEKELFPENIFSTAIFAIYNREKLYGYMVLNIDIMHDILYIYLQEIIGLSLKIINLWNEQLGYSRALEEAYKELKRYNYELKSIADRDVLTGLYNRRGFFEIATKMLEEAKKIDCPICVFFIDLDNLKQINDNLGHIEGDNALKETATILINSFRKIDLIARVGGDEFVVMSLNKKKDEKLVDSIMKRLINGLKKYNSSSNKPYILSFSVGVNSFNPYEVKAIEHMLTIVDEKLYVEKKRKKSFRD